jgi:hypothetical protein
MINKCEYFTTKKKVCCYIGFLITVAYKKTINYRAINFYQMFLNFPTSINNVLNLFPVRSFQKCLVVECFYLGEDGRIIFK